MQLRLRKLLRRIQIRKPAPLVKIHSLDRTGRFDRPCYLPSSSNKLLPQHSKCLSGIHGAQRLHHTLTSSHDTHTRRSGSHKEQCLQNRDRHKWRIYRKKQIPLKGTLLQRRNNSAKWPATRALIGNYPPKLRQILCPAGNGHFSTNPTEFPNCSLHQWLTAQCQKRLVLPHAGTSST